MKTTGLYGFKTMLCKRIIFAVIGKSSCLFWDKYKRNKYIVVNLRFFNFKLVVYVVTTGL